MNFYFSMCPQEVFQFLFLQTIHAFCDKENPSVISPSYSQLTAFNLYEVYIFFTKKQQQKNTALLFYTIPTKKYYSHFFLARDTIFYSDDEEQEDEEVEEGYSSEPEIYI